MSKQIIVPFGPQHPVLPEPITLTLSSRRAGGRRGPPIGYIHRGFEKLVEKREFTEYTLSRNAPAGSAASSMAQPTARRSSRS
jgi:NADH:ubiquinone oxidoreductase subunit D